MTIGKKISKKPAGAVKPAPRPSIGAMPQIIAALVEPSPLPRVPPLGVQVFHLAWDSSRLRDLRHRSPEKQYATGVKFDESGFVALSNGQTFENIDMMEHLLGLAGEYAIDWA